MNKNNITRTGGSQDNTVVTMKLYTLEKLDDVLKVDKNLQSVLALSNGDLSIVFGQGGKIKSINVIDSNSGKTIANTKNLAALGQTARLAKEHLETAQKTGASRKKVTLVTQILKQAVAVGIKIKADASSKISELERRIENLEENLTRFISLDEDVDEEKFKKTLCVCGALVHSLMLEEMVELATVGFEANRFEKKLMEEGIPGTLYGKLTSSGLVGDDVDKACTVLFGKSKPLGNLSITTAEILSGEVIPTMAAICHDVHAQVKSILSLMTVLKQPSYPAAPGNIYDEELLRFKWILTPKKEINAMVEEYSIAAKRELQKRSFEDKNVSGPIVKVLTFLDAYNVNYAMAMRGQMYGPTCDESYWPNLVKDKIIQEWEGSDETLSARVNRLVAHDFKIEMKELHSIAVEYALTQAGLFSKRLTDVLNTVNDKRKWGPPTSTCNSRVVNCAFESLATLELVVSETVKEFDTVDTSDPTLVRGYNRAILSKLGAEIEKFGDKDELLPLAMAFLLELTSESKNPLTESGLKTHVIDSVMVFTSDSMASEITRVKRRLIAENVTTTDIENTMKITGLRLPGNRTSKEKGRKMGIGGTVSIKLESDALAALEEAKDMEYFNEFHEKAVHWLRTSFVGSPRMQVIGANMFISNIENLEIIMREEGLLEELYE